MVINIQCLGLIVCGLWVQDLGFRFKDLGSRGGDIGVMMGGLRAQMPELRASTLSGRRFPPSDKQHSFDRILGFRVKGSWFKV
jgi:hypothetical protein